MNDLPNLAGETMRAEIVIPADAARQLTTAVSELELVRELFPGALPSADMANLAGEHLLTLRKRRDVLVNLKEKLTKPARDIINTALGMFQPGIKANEAADAYVSRLLGDWTVEQRRLAEEARRKAEAEAREKRLAEERAAAAARARAEEESRQKAQDAARAAQAAREQQTAEAAAKAAAAQAEADAARIDEQDAAQAQLQLASAPLAVTQTALAPADPAGVGMSDHWTAELQGPDIAVKQEIVAAIAGVSADALKRPELLAYLSLDTTALNRSAVAQKSLMNVPGVKAVNRPTATRRRGR